VRADESAPERSEQAIWEEVNRNFRWNVVVSFLDGAFLWIGLSLISYTTILPLFVSKITLHPFPIALVAVIGQSSWYLPQLFAAGPTEKLARKKPVVVNLGFFTERLPVWFMPVAALMSIKYPLLALVIFFLSYAAHGLGAGIIAPAWTDMLARIFPVNRRGRFFGITAFVGTGLGALGALFSGWLLKTFPFPTNFAYAFFLAALAINLSWVFLALTRESAQPVPPEIKRQRTWSWDKIASILRSDKNFRRYLIVRLLASFGNMAVGFITVAAIQRWSVPDATVGLYTAALLVGQTVGNLAAGFIADRVGHKRSLQVGLSGIVAAYLLAWLSPDPIWFNLVFFLVGVATGIAIVSGVLINMEFSRPERRPTYVGIANTTMGIGSVASPLVGGLLALRGYNLLFVMSAMFALAALIMLVAMVQEPRNRSEIRT
jgi:MFS family permease